MQFRTIAAVVACAAAMAVATPSLAFEPGKVDCIAPANPGGGWDFTCRTVGKILYDLKLVPNPVQVTNMAGGGGGVAYTHVVSKRDSDANLLVAASTATTTRLAQNQFAGMEASQVRWVAALGADFGVIAVAKDSEFKTLNDLLDAIKADPSKVAFGGGSAVGGWDHLKVLLTAKAAGIQDVKSVKYVSFNSGGDALTQLLGGHVQAFTGDISEIKGQLDAGNIRALAILSEERLPTDRNIATAKEQGYDVIGANWRGFYIPGGVSDEVVDGWGAIMDKLYQSDEWKQAMKQNGIAPFWRGGDDMAEFVAKQIADIQDLSKEVGLVK